MTLNFNPFNYLLHKLFGSKHFNSIEMDKDTANEIMRLAKESYPKEFFAYVNGKVKEDVLKLDGLNYQIYYSSREFAMVFNNLPLLHGCVASVHSHPTASNRPSRADLQSFSKNGLVHFIICKPYAQQDIACYDKNGNRIEFKIE